MPDIALPMPNDVCHPNQNCTIRQAQPDLLNKQTVMSETIQVTVVLFAGLKETVGSSTVSLSLPSETTCAEVKAELLEQYPSTRKYASQLLVARDSVYLSDTETINDQDELACFPPVSGG